MAISVSSVKVDHSSVSSRQSVTAECVIENSGGSAVTCTLVPYLPSGASGHHSWPASVSVAAGGSERVSWELVFDQPSIGDGRQQIKYDVLARVEDSDGGYTAVTGPSVLVTSGPMPVYFVTGPGALRLDSNLLGAMRLLLL